MAAQFETLFDIRGRQILPGDILRVDHFRMARWRKKMYMYKIACQSDANRNLGTGDRLLALHIELPLEAAHGYWLKYSLEGTEIIDGPSMRDKDGDLRMWCERPKNKNVFELGWELYDNGR